MTSRAVGPAGPVSGFARLQDAPSKAMTASDKQVGRKNTLLAFTLPPRTGFGRTGHARDISRGRQMIRLPRPASVSCKSPVHIRIRPRVADAPRGARRPDG